MKSRNGVSKNFRFRVVEGTAKTNYDFSFKHNALEEFYEEKFLYTEVWDYSVKQKFKCLIYFFTIKWIDLFDGVDSDKYKEVTNAERRGAQIFIIPHLDVPRRHFQVIRLKDSKGELRTEFSQTIDSRESQGNKGTVSEWRTVGTFSSWETIDPSTIQGSCQKIFQRINF